MDGWTGESMFNRAPKKLSTPKMPGEHRAGGMLVRSAALTVSLAALAAPPAFALRYGQVSVSASVVSSIVVRPVELLSVRREKVAGGMRTVAFLRFGTAGPVLVEQSGKAPVQLAFPEPDGGRFSVVLPEGGGGEVVVTVLSDASPPGHRGQR